jgi:iron complex outermembrane receptor protein
MKRSINLNVFFLITILCINHISSAQHVVVTGKVRHGDEPLDGATVSLGKQVRLTDSKGLFSFSIKPATYMLTITYAGYKKIEQTVVATADNKINFDFDLEPHEFLEEVTLGSRSAIQRSNLNTAVPVDVFSSEKLTGTGHIGLIQSLHYLAPSVNTGRQEFIEPVTLRGLAPDYLLILVNGVRYHNAAALNNGSPKSSLGPGSVINDLNSIPFSAIEKVEILRDGASAQYGSDGIAGVMNIQLKRTTGKASFQTHSGQYYKGDGAKFWLGGYKGFSLRNKGFLGLAADIRYQGPTTRAGEFTGTAYYNYPAGATGNDSAMIKAKDDSVLLARGIDKKIFSKYNAANKITGTGLMTNGDYHFSDRTILSWASLVNYKINQNYGSYRFFTAAQQVNTELYPDGFKPLVKITELDYTLTTALETMTRKNWQIKWNSSLGANKEKNFVSHSNNASQQFTLGKDAPTKFFLGEFGYRLILNNISFTKNFASQTNHFKTLNLAAGAEWRLENYQQVAGDEASWKNYDTSKTGGAQPSIGSVNADDVMNKNRNVSAAYIDMEIEPGDRLLLNMASRYEYYSDFGGNLAGKLAARYKLFDKLSLRAAIGNGFRAPAMQQRFFEGTQSDRGSEQISGIFSNSSPVTKAFNIPSLQAERSIHFSTGITSKLSERINLTVDAYWIQIKNRIVLSGIFDKTNPDIANILSGYPDIDLVQFYVNALNTRTKGIDVVINSNWNFHKTNIALSLAAGFNRNTIYGPVKTTTPISDTARFTTTLFGEVEKVTLEKDQPRKKIILSVEISRGRFKFGLRNTLFGSTATADIVSKPTRTQYEYFASKILTDVNLAYNAKHWLTISAGANNLFNVYPDRLKYPRNHSMTIYSNGATPFGYNGGYYYLGMSFNW